MFKSHKEKKIGPQINRDGKKKNNNKKVYKIRIGAKIEIIQKQLKTKRQNSSKILDNLNSYLNENMLGV